MSYHEIATCIVGAYLVLLSQTAINTTFTLVTGIVVVGLVLLGAVSRR